MKIFVVLFLWVGLNVAYGVSKTPAMEKISSPISFTDDLDMENMLKAIERQLKYFNRTNLNTKSKFGQRLIKRSHLKKSLLRFKELSLEAIECVKVSAREACFETMSAKINKEYEIYRPKPLSWEEGYGSKKTLFTAYYSPDFVGSFKKTAIFNKPIYRKPKDPKLASLTSDQINYTDALKGGD